MTRDTSTATLPARLPDGWWTGHRRYRSYMLFTATGIVLVAVNVVLLLAIRALAAGAQAWASYLAALGSPPGLLVTIALLLGTLFFAVRWLRVGAKIPGALLGPLQGSTVPLILAAHFAGFVTISLVVLVLLSGVVV